MNKETAKEFVRTILECNGLLAHAADLSKQDGDADGSKAIRKRLAHIMMGMFDDLVVPTWEAHPDLMPDEERSNFEQALKQRGGG